MTEAENVVVEEEVANPVAEEEETPAQEQPEQEEVKEVKETDQQMNFRKLREANEQLQKEREKDRQMMMALQEELLKRSGQSKKDPEPEIDEFAGLANDDWLTYEQSKKLAMKIASEVASKAVESDRAKRLKEEIPQRIKSKFQDFDSVVTEQNVKQLQALEPDVAKALSMIVDEEAQAVAAYKYIKAFLPKAAENTASKLRIQQNANAPKSLSAAGGGSPLAKANAFGNGLTPELKKQLLAEMEACARQG